MNQSNVTPNEGQKNKNINVKNVDQEDVKKMSEAGEDEASLDSSFKNGVGYDDVPNPATGKDDKEIDLDRSGKNFQQGQKFQQQEQQQAGIPTLKSQDGDAVARRAGMNSGTQGIGTGSARGYEGNTDDSGLPQDDDMNLASTDDERDLTGAGGDDIDDVGDESKNTQLH